MMFNKFAVFTLLTVTVFVVPAIGHPTEELASGINETAATVKTGIRGFLKHLHAKIVKHEENCTHDGGVIRWVKNKLGLTKKTTTETPTTTTVESDYSGGYVSPVYPVVNQGEPEETYSVSPDDDITILEDAQGSVPDNEGGNESVDAVDPTYASVAENVVDPSDPDIDVRGNFRTV